MKVYTGGTFDLFHSGHVEFLERCRALAGSVPSGGRVIVGLNTDKFVERFKGRAPAVPYDERAAVLRACQFVDDVIKNTSDEDSRPTIKLAKPNLLVIGSDWHARDYLTQLGLTWEWLHHHSITLAYVPRVTPASSTAIRERLR